MPCLVLTGHPCVGKTRIAELLKDRALLHDKIQHVEIVNEESVCVDSSKSDCYLDSHHEKSTRGALKARVDAALISSRSNTLVIVDSLNYIKGFRYELHCITKAQQDRHGVLWVLLNNSNNTQVAREWNRKRKDRYTDEQMEELVLRYEPPDARNRWDRPLYRLDLTTAQEGGTTAAETMATAQQDVLQRSVYNMHSLSEVINGTSSSTTTTTKKTPTSTNQTAASTFKRRTAASTFRRANNKNSNNDNTPPSPTTPVVIPAEETTVIQPPPTTPIQSDVTVPHGKNDTTSTPQKSLQDRIDDILDSFLNDIKPLKEGISTQQAETADADTLHQLDRCTLQVCQAIVNAQQEQYSDGAVLVLKFSESVGVVIMKRPSRTVSSMELKRLRQQYLQWAGLHPPEDVSEKGLVSSFVQYLEAQ